MRKRLQPTLNFIKEKKELAEALQHKNFQQSILYYSGEAHTYPMENGIDARLLSVQTYERTIKIQFQQQPATWLSRFFFHMKKIARKKFEATFGKNITHMKRKIIT